MAFPLPPWLSVQPALFTQALEAGARAGLAVSEQQQRAFALAEARSERAARDAERQREFEETRLLNVQRLGQEAARLQQQVAHQTAQEAAQAAQESRLLDYNTGQLAVANKRVDLASKIQGTAPTTIAPSGTTPGYILDPRGVPHYFPGSEPTMAKPTIEDLGEGVVGVRVSPQKYQVISKPPVPKEGALNDVQKARLRRLDAEARELRTTLPTRTTSPVYIASTNRLAEIQREGDQIMAGAGGNTNAPTVLAPSAPRGVTGTIHPLPKRKADLVVGDLYEDPKRGVGRWTGTRFEAVEVR